jgi:hypothetical protein
VFHLFDIEILTKIYNQFLSIFPEKIHWLVSLIVLIAISVAFIKLIRYHWVFILVLIIFIPALIPIFRSFFLSLWDFVLFLWGKVEAIKTISTILKT